MRARVLVVAGLLAVACSSEKTHVRGPPEPARLDAGDVFVERVSLSYRRSMVKVVGLVDAPPWRVWNAITDLENYPLWNSLVREVKVKERHGDEADAVWDMEVAPVGHADPVNVHIRVDGERQQVTITGFENFWMHSMQVVYTLEPHDDGKKTVFTCYSMLDVKSLLAQFAPHEHEESAARAFQSLRSGVQFPQFARAPGKPVAPTERTRLVIMGFASTGVAPEVPVTAGRVLAEELMRRGRFNIITEDEMAAMLEHARRRELAGCAGGADCMLDVGKSLDAQHLVHGSIAKLGDRFLFTASMIGMPDGTVEQRISEEAASDVELIDRVRRSAELLAR